MITKKTIEQELQKRRLAKPIPITLREDFSNQNAFVNDTSRFVAAQCSRRSGKSNGLAIRFFRTMEKHPGSQCLYLSLTQDSARQIMWPVLQELNQIHKIGCTFTDSSLMMRHPNGSSLKLMGADLKDFIKRLKGRKHPGIAIDEAQDFGSHLQSLVNDVLTPCIADYEDGWLAMTGTPGPVPQGYFFDVTQNGKYGFSMHKWTVVDNPYMPNPASFLEGEKQRNEWADDNPTYLREWKNQWVLDVKSLWIQYSKEKNDYIELPKNHKFSYVLGVDLGFKDADAIAVVAWSETTPVTYLVEESITNKQGTKALIDEIDRLQRKYNAYKIVLDEGGLGKKIAEDIRQRFLCPLEPADKAQKQSNVEFLNDDMRRGRFMAKASSRFALDSYLIQIDWAKSSPNKIVIKKDPHSDIIDAVLYAYRESYGYTHSPDKKKPLYGTPEWHFEKQQEIWEKDTEHREQEKHLIDLINGKW